MMIDVSAVVPLVVEVLAPLTMVALACFAVHVALVGFKWVRMCMLEDGGGGGGSGGHVYTDADFEAQYAELQAEQRQEQYLQALAQRLDAENKAEENAFFGPEPDWSDPNVTSGAADSADAEFAAFKASQDAQAEAAAIDAQNAEEDVRLDAKYAGEPELKMPTLGKGWQ